MKKLLYDVHERPRPLLHLVLSLQHVVAMFGATILVPLIVGLPVSVALFASGLGTLIYIIATKAQVPVYLGSSFAFISAMLAAGLAASQTGIFMVGLVYVAVAFIIKAIGNKWLHKLLPPIVIGPMIVVIGLGLANWGVTQAGFVAGADPKVILVSISTLLITMIAITKGHKFIKMIPFIVGIIGGYLIALVLGLVDLSVVAAAPWFQIPQFMLPYVHYTPDFGPAMWAIVPIAIVTISEHIGDHTVLGTICERDFLEEPGLTRTLIGDGIATSVSALLGGPANTTYGENTGVVGLTRVASVWVTGGAATIAILLSFVGKVSAIISTIPAPVLGGMSLILYGAIASNGLKVLIDNKVDIGHERNLIIAAVMLVLGLGGAMFPLAGSAVLSGTALAGIAGVLLNRFLPKAE